MDFCVRTLPHSSCCIFKWSGQVFLFLLFIYISLFCPTSTFARKKKNSGSDIYCGSMRVLPTLKQSAKCHLSTWALMINTILMVSINFLLHQQKAAVALSLSWPCTCFGKPLCGSCWMKIVCFPPTHEHTITQTDVPNRHTRNRTHSRIFLKHTCTLLHGALLPAFQTLAHR